MAIGKPSSLESFLDYLNIDRGQWVDISISIPFAPDVSLHIPPFSLNFGDWIETAIDYVLIPIDVALEFIYLVMATADDIYKAGLALAGSIGEVIQETAAELWDGINALAGEVYSGFETIYAMISSGLASVRTDVSIWIAVSADSILRTVRGQISDAIDGAFDSIRAPINLISQFFDEIQELFSDPEDYIINKLESALDRFW